MHKDKERGHFPYLYLSCFLTARNFVLIVSKYVMNRLTIFE